MREILSLSGATDALALQDSLAEALSQLLGGRPASGRAGMGELRAPHRDS